MNPKYTEEQIADITERETKALKTLEELKLTPSAVMSKIRLEGTEDSFGDKVQPYLRDTKFVRDGDKFIEAILSTDKETNPNA